MNNQLAHIKSCKESTEVWKTLCNIHETKNLFNVIFIHRKFFTCMMQENNNLLDHVNKIKVLVDLLACLDVQVWD